MEKEISVNDISKIEKQNIKEYKEKKSKFWGKGAVFCQKFYKFFTKRYKSEIIERDEPCVYVCRHLNMRGPLTTLKNIDFHLHPLVLSTFFTQKETENHIREVLLKKKPNKIRAKFLGWFIPKLLLSLQAVPVYRNSNPIKTFKKSMEYLEKGESLIIYPDIDYKNGYEKDGDIYNGFLFLSVLYKNKTGKDLKFIPLYIDKKNKVIKEREEVVILDYKKDLLVATNLITKRINKQ